MPTKTVANEMSIQQTKLLLPSLTKRERPIIWALDPTENDASRLKPLADAIESWRHRFPGEILPVSILSPAELNWPVEFIAPLGEKLVFVANEFLKPAVRESFAHENLEPHIILQTGFSHRKAARQLLDYAKKHKAQLIAVNTHGRRGFDRFKLGSFAELLLTQDDVPVLVLNSKAHPSPAIKTIGFPTDFSTSSKQAYKKAIKFAKELRATLKLIHVYTMPGQIFSDSDFAWGVSVPGVEDIWREAELEQRDECGKWVQIAADNGVDADFVFSKDTGRTGELITRIAAEQNIDLIYLSTAYGPIGQTFLGGTIRDILATAEAPVLVRHFREATPKKGA